MFSKSFQKIFILAIISLILLTSCDSVNIHEVNSLPVGTCQIKVEGYLNKTFTGKAVYENLPIGDIYKTPFFLILENVVERNKDYRVVELQITEKPSKGLHDIHNIHQSTSQREVMASYSDSETMSLFNSTGGNIFIDDASGSKLKGFITFTAVSRVTLGEEEPTIANIKVNVKFHAIEGSVGIIIN